MIDETRGVEPFDSFVVKVSPQYDPMVLTQVGSSIKSEQGNLDQVWQQRVRAYFFAFYWISSTSASVFDAGKLRQGIKKKAYVAPDNKQNIAATP